MRGLQTTELGDIRSTYDTVVIGAGPAGCVTRKLVLHRRPPLQLCAIGGLL